MLDVLIIVSDTTPPAFITECRASVAVAAKAAGFPVTVTEVPGVPGHIGQAMANGIVRSSQPYVAWVDDDDYVLPSAFSCLEEHFASEPAAICAREIELYANGQMLQNDERHHLTAFRRDYLAQQDLSPFRATPNVALLRRLPARVVDVRAWVYVRRVRRSEAMRLRGELKQQEAPLWLA